MIGARLNTLHNLHYYQDLMRSLRRAVEENTFQITAKAILEERKRYNSALPPEPSQEDQQ